MAAVTDTRNSSSNAAHAKRRANERDLIIPDPLDPDRRRQLEADDAAWLRHYCRDVFYNPFTADQLAMIADVGESLRYGSKKCKAAPRGGGKSSILTYLVMKYGLCRQVRFPLVVAATFGKAQKTTSKLRRRLASKSHGTTELAALTKKGVSTKGIIPNHLFDDYPMECTVARYVDPWPSRARNVTGNGLRDIHVEWGAADGYFILPTWSDVEPLGPIIMSLGWSSDELQGCNIYDVRPDFIMLDDLDSRASLSSEHGVVAGKIEETIEKTISGMIGPSRRLGQYMLCTITSTDAAAYRYSDPQIKPSWDGTRVQAIRKWPTNTELWDKYCWLRQTGMQEGDTFGRAAHQFYLANREAMDAGAEVSNPHDFDQTKLKDSTQVHLSNLQKCFDFIADTSREAFDTEYQNDPPKRESQLEVQVTAYHVGACADDLNQGQCDPTTTMIVRGMDVRKTELHHVTMASEAARPHRIVDYNVRSHGTSETTVEQAEVAILQGFRQLADEWVTNPPTDSNGTAHSVDLTLIDKGWLGNWTEDGAVKTWASQPAETFCLEMGLRHWLPAKAAPNYRSPKPSRGVIIGDNWHINRGKGQERKCDEVIWNAAHWHLLVEELFMLPEDDADRFRLFRATDGIFVNHKAFGEHITAGATQLKEMMMRGSRSRKPRFVRDHWWDSAAMMLVAKSVECVLRERDKGRGPRKSLSDMAKSARS